MEFINIGPCALLGNSASCLPMIEHMFDHHRQYGVAKSSDPLAGAGAQAVGPTGARRPAGGRQRRRLPGLVAEAPALPAAARWRPPPAARPARRALRRAP